MYINSGKHKWPTTILYQYWYLDSWRYQQFPNNLNLLSLPQLKKKKALFPPEWGGTWSRLKQAASAGGILPVSLSASIPCAPKGTCAVRSVPYLPSEPSSGRRGMENCCRMKSVGRPPPPRTGRVGAQIMASSSLWSRASPFNSSNLVSSAKDWYSLGGGGKGSTYCEKWVK